MLTYPIIPFFDILVLRIRALLYRIPTGVHDRGIQLWRKVDDRSFGKVLGQGLQL